MSSYLVEGEGGFGAQVGGGRKGGLGRARVCEEVVFNALFFLCFPPPAKPLPKLTYHPLATRRRPQTTRSHPWWTGQRREPWGRTRAGQCGARRARAGRGGAGPAPGTEWAWLTAGRRGCGAGKECGECLRRVTSCDTKAFCRASVRSGLAVRFFFVSIFFFSRVSCSLSATFTEWLFFFGSAGPRAGGGGEVTDLMKNSFRPVHRLPPQHPQGQQPAKTRAVHGTRRGNTQKKSEKKKT